MAQIAVSDPNVPEFNSYADVTFAGSYVELLSATNQSIWGEASVTLQNHALIWASQAIDILFEWPRVYERTDPDQGMEWPKKGVPVEGRRGLEKLKDTRNAYVHQPSNKWDSYYDPGMAYMLSVINQDTGVPLFPEESIPVFLAQATVDYAIIHLDQGKLEDLDAEEIKRVKLDVIEIEYFRALAQSRGAPVLQKLGKWGAKYRSDWADATGAKSGGRMGI